MIHIQTQIKDIIDKAFNASSDIVDFRVALYNDNIPADFAKKIEATDSYEITKFPYIPTVITDLLGDYIEVPNNNILNADIPIVFQIPTTEQNVENVLVQENTENLFKAMDNFRKNYCNIPLPVGDEVYQLYHGSEVLFSKNELETLGKLSISFRFNDRVPETILETYDDVTNGRFVIYKNTNAIEFKQNGIIESTFAYEEDTYYDITIESDVTTSSITINGTEQTPTNPFYIPAEFTLYKFEGYIEYLGVGGFGTLGYDELLIEDFITLNDTSTNASYTITYDDTVYGANLFGKDGLIMFGLSAVTPVSQQYQGGTLGLYLQQFQLILSATYAVDMFPGNFYRYFINGTEIWPFAMNHGYATEPATEQMLNAATGETLNRSNTIGTDLTFYHKNDRVMNEISRNFTSLDTQQNKEYTFEVHTPTKKEQYMAVVTQFGAPPVKNTMATITLSLQPKRSL